METCRRSLSHELELQVKWPGFLLKRSIFNPKSVLFVPTFFQFNWKNPFPEHRPPPENSRRSAPFFMKKIKKSGPLFFFMTPIPFSVEQRYHFCWSQRTQQPGCIMRHLRILFQHYCNPLHVYCRLRDLGMGSSTALRMCSLYQRVLFRKPR